MFIPEAKCSPLRLKLGGLALEGRDNSEILNPNG